MGTALAALAGRMGTKMSTSSKQLAHVAWVTGPPLGGATPVALASCHGSQSLLRQLPAPQLVVEVRNLSHTCLSAT
jgi:hypothetical protein